MSDLVIAHACRPYRGETDCGDIAFVRRSGTGVLFGVVDALGHGAPAQRVAEQARRILMEVKVDERLEVVFAALHRGLHGTRGAAATICRFEGKKLFAAGIGNVELRCMNRSFPMVATPGIIGGRGKPVRVSEAMVEARERIFVFSDGISRRMDPASVAPIGVADACAKVLEQHAHDHDDATVLIAEVS